MDLGGHRGVHYLQRGGARPVSASTTPDGVAECRHADVIDRERRAVRAMFHEIVKRVFGQLADRINKEKLSPEDASFVSHVHVATLVAETRFLAANAADPTTVEVLAAQTLIEIARECAESQSGTPRIVVPPTATVS